ncbi:hypothetical protein ACIA6C_02365 [Streptomyces sp. NPDC051578]|uniref:hypothetical protein n=1 Tax=Streptomyces sp. NPDC051578 TaxID=3365662 RepID=UPI00379100F5
MTPDTGKDTNTTPAPQGVVPAAAAAGTWMLGGGTEIRRIGIGSASHRCARPTN